MTFTATQQQAVANYSATPRAIKNARPTSSPGMFKGIPLLWLLFAGLVSLTTKIDVTLLARVPVAEILIAFALPFLLAKASATLSSPRILLILAAVVMWTAGILISDLANDITMARSLRAHAKPFFCLLWLTYYAALLRADYRIFLITPVFGVIASIQNYLAPQSYTTTEIQSGGYEAVVYGVEPIVLALSSLASITAYRKSSLLSSLILLAAAAAVVSLGGARSTTFNLVVSAILITATRFFSEKPGVRLRIRKSSLLVAAVFVAGLTVLIAQGYFTAVKSGALGREYQEKHLAQTANTYGNTILGLLAGGRIETYGNLSAIRDNPLVGHGSWTAAFMEDYYYEAVKALGYSTANLPAGRLGIGHSALLTSWVENGFLSFIGLLIFSATLLPVTIKSLTHPNYLSPVILRFAVFLAWGLVFSPFGTSTRSGLGFFAALFLANFPSNNQLMRRGGGRNRQRQPLTQTGPNLPITTIRQECRS